MLEERDKSVYVRKSFYLRFAGIKETSQKKKQASIFSLKQDQRRSRNISLILLCINALAEERRLLDKGQITSNQTGQPFVES